ncbi:MAG TPA: hypothetical protein DEQ09_07535 [Bacteroidales bacterium]|mgnify:CR=1 FL=1|nr:hypothetical protein [Bacteroidales bacterium]
MKILMTLESSFPPDKRVENEIDTLLDEGHDIHILCTGISGALKNDSYKTATIHRVFPSVLIRKSSVAALKVPVYFSYWKARIRKVLKAHNFDVVHIHDLPLIKPVLQLRKIYDFKVVLDLHENWPALLDVSLHTKTFTGKILCSIPQWKNYERKYLPRADKIIVVVEEAKERLLNLQIPGNKIIIVSNTLNINEHRIIENDKEKTGGKKVIIYEGGITFHRGIQFVLKAISHIDTAARDLEFWIIGKGSYMEKLKKMSADLKLDHIVKFMGWQEQESVFELVNKADIAVIPHIKSEHTDTTVPHKLFHYMYAGLLILASDCVPLARIIKETSAGYIYQYNNTGQLADLLIRYASAEKKTKTNPARAWINKEYNWDKDAQQLINLYRSLS